MLKFFLTFVVTFLYSIFPGFGQKTISVIQIEGAISPVSADFIIISIEKAEKNGSECLIIELDTPGGLMKSMKMIIKDFFVSEIPIVVYVYPGGATSGSAGVFITLAAHVSAMAPGTNIGAAHPVTMGMTDTSSVMSEKILNDAVSYIRSIAQQRDKNEDWAEKAVRESDSITENQAKELNVIDFIAPNLDSLLVLLDGYKVTMESGERIINTKNAVLRRWSYNWRYRLLDTISDPNIAYIFLLLGIYGIIFEIMNPGALVPGVVGGISIIIAFFALQTLPINYAGLLLIIVAVVLFLLEIKIASYGLLTISGIVSLTLGSIMLIESPLPYLKISWSVIISSVIFTTLFFILIIGLGIKAQFKKSTTGKEGVIGMTGVARTDINPEGTVFVAGEIWKAYSDEKIEKDQKIKVTDMKEFTLNVKKTES